MPNTNIFHDKSGLIAYLDDYVMLVTQLSKNGF